MNDSLKTLLIVGFLALILWNLGAGLYYMLVDKGQTKRTVNALTKRIATEAAARKLILLTCGTYGNVIRILVPLTASDALLDEGLAIIAECFDAALAS